MEHKSPTRKAAMEKLTLVLFRLQDDKVWCAPFPVSSLLILLIFTRPLTIRLTRLCNQLVLANDTLQVCSHDQRGIVRIHVNAPLVIVAKVVHQSASFSHRIPLDAVSGLNLDVVASFQGRIVAHANFLVKRFESTHKRIPVANVKTLQNVTMGRSNAEFFHPIASSRSWCTQRYRHVLCPLFHNNGRCSLCSSSPTVQQLRTSSEPLLGSCLRYAYHHHRRLHSKNVRNFKRSGSFSVARRFRR
jgi:hypothetical protein